MPLNPHLGSLKKVPQLCGPDHPYYIWTKKANLKSFICSTVVGLASPVSKQSFPEHTKYWEQLSKELCTENIKMARENVKKLVREVKGLHIDENIVDTPTMIDGVWNSRGWTASRGIVSAIAENTSQTLDVAYKTCLCSQCFGMEERKKNGACSTLEYFDWYINMKVIVLLTMMEAPK